MLLRGDFAVRCKNQRLLYTLGEFCPKASIPSLGHAAKLGALSYPEPLANGSEVCEVVTGREACEQAGEDQVVLY
jgi:rRNA maturation protein Nop10